MGLFQKGQRVGDDSDVSCCGCFWCGTRSDLQQFDCQVQAHWNGYQAVRVDLMYIIHEVGWMGAEEVLGTRPQFSSGHDKSVGVEKAQLCTAWSRHCGRRER